MSQNSINRITLLMGQAFYELNLVKYALKMKISGNWLAVSFLLGMKGS